MPDILTYPSGEQEVPASPGSLIDLSKLTRGLFTQVRSHYDPDYIQRSRRRAGFDVVYSSEQEYLGDLNARTGRFFSYPSIDPTCEQTHLFELGHDENWSLMSDGYPEIGAGMIISFRRGGEILVDDTVEVAVIVRNEGGALVQHITNGGEASSGVMKRRIGLPVLLSENGALSLQQDIVDFTSIFQEYELQHPGFIIDPDAV